LAEGLTEADIVGSNDAHVSVQVIALVETLGCGKCSKTRAPNTPVTSATVSG